MPRTCQPSTCVAAAQKTPDSRKPSSKPLAPRPSCRAPTPWALPLRPWKPAALPGWHGNACTKPPSRSPASPVHATTAFWGPGTRLRRVSAEASQHKASSPSHLRPHKLVRSLPHDAGPHHTNAGTDKTPSLRPPDSPAANKKGAWPTPCPLLIPERPATPTALTLPPGSAPTGLDQAENDEPHPQVVAAFGFLITNCDPCRSSL